MSESRVYIDRYSATGTPYPDPETMCQGQCDGMGFYPQHVNDMQATAEESKRWVEQHNKPDAHEDEPCDGWHFIVCPDCEGSRLRPKE